jgi:subtilisin family serine protease
MSEYIFSAHRLIRDHSELKVVNLSLGYNWIANLGSDPRSDTQLRDLIRSQGLSALSLLEYAKEKGVTLVSAAGNDSRGLITPLDARFSSPINYAAFLMASDSLWSNVLVVEAHDRGGKRPPFSNIGGQISCPGVEVQSTVASPTNWIGVDDGTSMAAPYCAAALVALRSLIPSLDQGQAIACLLKSNRHRENVPMLNLKYAVENCGSNSLANAPNERAGNMRARSESLMEPAPLATSNGGCRYEMRREFKITPIADLGDGQGPVFSNARSGDEVRQYARSLIRRGCSEPLFIVAVFGYDPEAQLRQEFAQAVMQEIFRVKYPGGVAMIQWPFFGEVGDTPRFTDRVIVMIGDRNFEDRLTGD